MLKEPFTPKFYTFNSKYIRNVMSLRDPQHESLEIFAKLCDVLSLSKTPDLEKELEAVRTMFPTLTDFEREFPSFCFSLATGIGKTRLMGACIAYLRYEKKIKNFFVMAPNLTIYEKLKNDLVNPASEKYVFKGLDLFVKPPRIIDGDNYREFRQIDVLSGDVTINVFNISKLNAESKGKDGKPARIKRLNEVLGLSYFQYLQSLPDLCIFMDESHHYHADKSFEVINELKPVLGVELTATPQIQKGSKAVPFKNVVYEYTLAHALNDGMFVKVPAVFTRRDFRSEEYTPEQLDHEKLNDGLRIHEETKSHLEVYARNHGKKIVKPFVLVVAKDTEHARHLMEYIKSNDFFGGYYADKVMEIHSDQKKTEKDENIQKLLSLEAPDNKIEIVIHVNMLKEGWDVTNLYTIIPLRTSASETLTEQTIGRGLRLPYGERTGVDEVDRLSIVSHDKYAAIVNLANDPNSLIRKVYYIDPSDDTHGSEQRETIEMPTAYETATTDSNVTEQLALVFQEETKKTTGEEAAKERAEEVARFVAGYASKSVIELNKQVKTFDAVHDEETQAYVKQSVITETIKQFPDMDIAPEVLEVIVEKAVAACVQALTGFVIPIPKAVVQPYTKVNMYFQSFTLNTSSMNWHASDDTLIGTELQEDGKTFEMNSEHYARKKVDTAENEIVRHIIVHDNVDYMSCADLLYSLVNDAKQHFLTYLSEEDTERVMRDRQKTIADIIYAQMQEHFYHEETDYKSSKIRPFTKIITGFGGKYKSDEIYDLRANIPLSEIPKKIFGGFTKACHTLYKFDSGTERDFAIVLERDTDILKWLRPAPEQFDIRYGTGYRDKYEPDFIVETADTIYMVETKASKDLTSESVLKKAKAAKTYCDAVTEWNKDNNGKPWEYVLLSHEEVRINSSFMYLVKNSVRYEQMILELS